MDGLPGEARVCDRRRPEEGQGRGMRSMRPDRDVRVRKIRIPTERGGIPALVLSPLAAPKDAAGVLWLHGGGFSAGSSIEQVAYDGANMARLGNVVVVSVNHRLNILGYFDLSEYGEEYANSGNAGGDDIIAALSWVHDNIAAFGGDPECVTVFGQSGGGAKVTTLLQSPAADGLYARGMVMSGVVGKMLVSEETSAKPLAEAMMRELGVKTVREMETVDYFFLARAYRKVSPELQRQGKYVGCAPRKNDYYYGDPVEYGFRKETSHIPLLVGSVFGEFTSFKAAAYDRNVMTEEEQMQALEETLGKESVGKLLPLFRSTYPRRAPIDLLRLDFLFRAPEHPYLAARAKLNRSTWSYLFDMDQPVDGGSTPWHCCDIPYFFQQGAFVFCLCNTCHFKPPSK